jgi:hypothetical protein
MRNSFTMIDAESLSAANGGNSTEQPAPQQFVLQRVTLAELALKVKQGQLGSLKPCSYSPSSHTLKLLHLS